MAVEVEVGQVTHFFPHPMVAGITLSDSLKVGDRLHIKGHTTDMVLVVESMEINNVPVKEAKGGDEVGIKVPDRARGGDRVYKVLD